MFIIDKEFNWEGGHRVWSQKLNERYALDTACVCRHLHGHSYRCKIGLSSQTLNNGMVTDFKHLNFVKSIIDTYLDHKFMLDISDPLFDTIFPDYKDIASTPECAYTIKDFKGFFKYVDVAHLDEIFEFKPEELEHIESFVVVDFVPTSENICKFLYELINFELEDLIEPADIKLEFVELWETPKSHCKYTGNQNA